MTLRWNPRAATRGTVVLLHDALSMSETWWRVGPALASQGWKTVAPDLAGHGGMPNLHRSLEMAELVRGVVERMPGKVDLLVGHGLGAIVALSLAGRYHDAARAVVLEDPPGTNHFESAGLLALAGARSALVRSDRERLVTDIGEAHPAWTREDVEYAVEAVAAADVPAVLAGLRCRMEWDLRRLLSYVRVPVLVLAPLDDMAGTGVTDGPPLSVADRKAIADRLPDQHFLVLNGGHHLHRDVPREWLGGVTEFADSILPDTILDEQATSVLNLVEEVDEADQYEISHDAVAMDVDDVDSDRTHGKGKDTHDHETVGRNWADEEHEHERTMLLFDRPDGSSTAQDKPKPGTRPKDAAKARGNAAKVTKTAAKNGKTPPKTPGKAAAKASNRAAVRPTRLGKGGR